MYPRVGVYVIGAFCVAAVVAQYVTNYDHLPETWSGHSPTFTVANFSRVQCAATCARVSWCQGADYTPASRSCGLLAVAMPGNAVERNGSSYLCCSCEQFPPPDPTPHLLGFWPMTVRYGSRDVGVAGCDGVAYAVTYNSAACWSLLTHATYNGLTSYVHIPNTGALQVGSFTWTAWIKPTVGTPDGPLFHWSHPTLPAGGTRLWYLASGGALLTVADSSLGDMSALGTHHLGLTITVGAWNLVGVSFDVGSGRVAFVVNEMHASATHANLTGIDAATAGDVYVGSRFADGSADTQYFWGAITCMKLFDTSMGVGGMREALRENPTCGYITNWTAG